MLKVLFVDDPNTVMLERGIRELMKRFKGVMYRWVSGFDEAIEWARQERPEIVVVRGRSHSGLDEDGPGILARIRETYQPVREIMVTGSRGYHDTRLAKLDEVQRVYVVQTPDLHFVAPLVGWLAAPPSRIVLCGWSAVTDELCLQMASRGYLPRFDEAETMKGARALLHGSLERTVLVLGDGLSGGEGEYMLSLLGEAPGHMVGAIIYTATPFTFQDTVDRLSGRQVIRLVDSSHPRALESVLDGWVPRRPT